MHFVVLTALHSTALPLFYANTAGRDPPRSGLGPWQGKYGSIYTRGERLRSGHVRSRGRRGSQNLAHSLVSASTLRSAARSPCTAGAPRTPIPVAVRLTLSRRNPQRGGRAPTRQKRGHGDATEAHQACTSLPPPFPHRTLIRTHFTHRHKCHNPSERVTHNPAALTHRSNRLWSRTARDQHSPSQPTVQADERPHEPPPITGWRASAGTARPSRTRARTTSTRRRRRGRASRSRGRRRRRSG